MILTLLASRFVSHFRMETMFESFNSLPWIFVTAKADLLSSSFSQSGLQSRSPEAICKISDPESINRKKLTA